MAAQISPNQGHEALVDVFDTMEESEAMVVKGLLESSGIPALISALDAPQDVLPGVGGVVVRVPHEQAEEARQLIAELHRGKPHTRSKPESRS
jgi:Putative prokaryotic signal transducing protein